MKPQDVVDRTLAQLADSAVIQSTVSLLLKDYIPEYHGPTTFVPTRDGDRITVQTDIDYAAANRVYTWYLVPERDRPGVLAGVYAVFEAGKDEYKATWKHGLREPVDIVLRRDRSTFEIGDSP